MTSSHWARSPVEDSPTGGRAEQRQVREQAYRLTEAVFRAMNPKPMASVEQVTPLVYDLLVEGYPVATIEMALKETRAFTRNGLDYIVRSVARPQGAKPRMDPVKPIEWDEPTDAQRAHAQAMIAEARQRLHPTPAK